MLSFKKKRLRSTKWQFSYESPDEPPTDTMKKMEITFFNRVDDVCVTSLQEHFQNLGEVEERFWVLVSFPKLTNDEVMKQCQTLSNTLSASQD